MKVCKPAWCPSRRLEVRHKRGYARHLLDTASHVGPRAGRNLLEVHALQVLLGAVARSGKADIDPVNVVQASLLRSKPEDGAELLATLDRFGAPVPKQGIPESSREIRKLCFWIDGLLDDRTERELLLERIVPWVVLAVAMAGASQIVFGTRNLARGKHVLASSECPTMPPAPSQKPKLARVVDGDTVEGRVSSMVWGQAGFAACTSLEIHPWLAVDLGGEFMVHEIVVYNRSDCCWGIHDLPLSIQVSLDNQQFATVAKRHDPFTGAFPWRAAISPKRARYVRLFNAADQPKHIVISELEVHGR